MAGRAGDRAGRRDHRRWGNCGSGSGGDQGRHRRYDRSRRTGTGDRAARLKLFSSPTEALTPIDEKLTLAGTRPMNAPPQRGLLAVPAYNEEATLATLVS